ncbi:ABC-2 type transporter [Gemmatirosa kalamazoonensis]|uniref:ABC-2 type transporter n=1 Tax=Gemmatirosa kalamazoonensis TaxID=861299 RepID=W0RFV4_9BACT|nr:ABC transporter permease [Gemmatirosa kalamazoonensis]AHG89312.1 ABC-2 type transporter [Gemmatirosa kalamazoonensis]
MTALTGLLRKEVYHVLRDRRTLAVLVLLPVVQVILFGYSIRTDVNDVRLAVVDPAPDVATLALRSELQGTPSLRVVRTFGALDDDGIDSLFQRGAAQVVVSFEPRLAERQARGLAARVLVVADAAEPNGGSARLGYVVAVLRGAMSTRPSAGAGPAPLRIVPEVRMRFNPTRESANLFVPGLMAMVLTITSALMTALSLTREKESGTMEALLVSPLRPWQIVVGKVAPYLAIGFASVLLVLLEARLVFHVPVRGSVALLLAEGLLFILVSLALGILVSARTSSQRVAMMIALVGTMLPTMMLSGFVFPIESMPRALQIVTNIVPAKWFVLVARGIMLKGVGLGYLWRETLVLLGMAVVLLAASARSFRVRLEG